MRILAVSIGLLASAWIGPAAAHGCHHGWQQGTSDGWHSHGTNCDPRKGLGISRRIRPHGRRAA